MPEIPSSAVQPTKGGGGSAILKNLLPLLPGIAGAIKNPESLSAFMEGYQRTMAMLEGQDREREELTTRQQDREQVLTRQTEQDRIAADERARNHLYQDTERRMGYVKNINDVVQNGDFESPDQIISTMDSLLSFLPPPEREKLGGFRDAQIVNAPKVYSKRRRNELKAWVESTLMKSEHVATAKRAGVPVAKIGVTEALPARMRELVNEVLPGKDQILLGDLMQALEIMEQAEPASASVSMQPKEVLVNGKPVMANYNPKAGTYTDQNGQTVTADVIPPRASSGTDPEIAELRKELLRLQVENAANGKEPNQSQFGAAAYASRMEQAEPILTKVAPSIVGMSLPSFELQTNSWFAKPTFQSNEVQSYMQAARNFINAVLRRESGAVISPEEFSEARKQYLPVAGDTAEALQQKAANRQTVFANMKRASGKAYEPPVMPNPAGAVTVQTPAGPITFPNQAAADAYAAAMKKAGG